MSAEFLITDTFKLSSRNSFCLIGRITDGNIDEGMSIILPGSNVNLTISSVESVRSKKFNDLIGLLFKYNNEEELAISAKVEAGTRVIINN